MVGLEGLSAEVLTADLNGRVQRGDGALLPDLVACVGNGHTGFPRIALELHLGYGRHQI